MSKLVYLLLVLLLSNMALAVDTIELFYGPECHKCDQAKAALIDYQSRNSDIRIEYTNVLSSPEKSERLRYLAVKEKINNIELPLFYYRSVLRSGFREPQALLNWVDEVKENIPLVGEVNFVGTKFGYVKNGGAIFTLILAVKDFFFSFFGLSIILLTILSSLFFSRFEAIIALLSLHFGAIIGGILWSESSSRIFFTNYAMIDFWIATAVLIACVVLVIKKKLSPLGGWQELGFLSLGIILQRLFAIYTTPEIIRLQDTLLEMGIEGARQVGMNMFYGFIQFFLSLCFILLVKQLRKK